MTASALPLWFLLIVSIMLLPPPPPMPCGRTRCSPTRRSKRGPATSARNCAASSAATSRSTISTPISRTICACWCASASRPATPTTQVDRLYPFPLWRFRAAASAVRARHRAAVGRAGADPAARRFRRVRFYRTRARDAARPRRRGGAEPRGTASPAGGSRRGNMSIAVAIGLIGLTSLAVGLLLLPLLARQHKPRSREAYNLAVYRDQLAEIERDLARGLLTAGAGRSGAGRDRPPHPRARQCAKRRAAVEPEAARRRHRRDPGDAGRGAADLRRARLAGPARSALRRTRGRRSRKRRPATPRR